VSIDSRRAEILAGMAKDPTSARLLREITLARRAGILEKAGTPLHTTITARVSNVQIAQPKAGPTQRGLTIPIAGRLVRAGEANLNGTYFSGEDLEFGLSSLDHAPLTHNHSSIGAFGYLDKASLEETPEHGKHIVIAGRVWAARFPQIAESLQQSLEAGNASLSMECMAMAVACMAADCGFVYTEDLGDGACDHILARSEARRMMWPTFYGAGMILDGVKPGWPGASLTAN
jgi:hypothetical protein